MTDDIRKKAEELFDIACALNKGASEYEMAIKALCRAIEQREAFKQKVSDIVEAYVNATSVDDWEKLKTLIIPKPKPDPLVDVMEKLGWYNAPTLTKDFRTALEALGLEIREKNDDIY